MKGSEKVKDQDVDEAHHRHRRRRLRLPHFISVMTVTYLSRLEGNVDMRVVSVEVLFEGFHFSSFAGTPGNRVAGSYTLRIPPSLRKLTNFNAAFT